MVHIEQFQYLLAGLTSMVSENSDFLSDWIVFAEAVGKVDFAVGEGVMPDEASYKSDYYHLRRLPIG